MGNRIISSPDGKNISVEEMEDTFKEAGALGETIFRRLEFNEVIKYTKGVGVDVECGLNKIPSTEKFRNQTGWKPQIHFGKTLEDLLNYWRERM